MLVPIHLLKHYKLHLKSLKQEIIVPKRRIKLHCNWDSKENNDFNYVLKSFKYMVEKSWTIKPTERGKLLHDVGMMFNDS